MIILGIETSCDETAAAVYTTAQGIRSNVLYSQIALQQQYGGVMPEIAARTHLEKIRGIVEEALSKAQVSLKDIDAIAVTNKPGLSGSLLIGLCFAKGIALAQHKKLIGVNHLEGHIFSAHIEHAVPFPYLCLTASGGHTALYYVEDYGKYTLVGQTVDDAAGEAFDKIARLIGLTYPGGPLIEKLAKKVNFQDFFHYPRLKKVGLDFSFSGLKTAVLYDLVKRGAYDMASKKLLNHDPALQEQVASSLLVCIADIFEQRLLEALKLYPHAQAVTFVGGVACNQYIKSRLNTLAQSHNKQFFSPSPAYCTDNGAMIAFVGHYKAEQGLFSPLTLDVFE